MASTTGKTLEQLQREAREKVVKHVLFEVYLDLLRKGANEFFEAYGEDFRRVVDCYNQLQAEQSVDSSSESEGSDDEESEVVTVEERPNEGTPEVAEVAVKSEGIAT